MFEKLLQRILKEFIGEFTEQIDTNNLSVGVWSGEIQINKVKLNRNLFKKLGLPINVIFSFISQLKIKIPWKSFFSSPLIISIDSAFALCEVDSVLVSEEERKHMFINSLKLIIANIGKKLIQKIRTEDDKESGYFETILLKMFDNLYLSIKNVHFRFENIEKQFSFGLLLDSIDIHAVDEKNNSIFVDRNKLKQNDKAIRRKFSLSKLRFYWEPVQSNFISQKQPKERQQYFLNSKKFNQTKKTSLMYIFFLDLEGLIIENYAGKSPFYDVYVNQEKIEINLKKQIIEQSLFLAKKIQQLLQQTKSTKQINSQCSHKSYAFLRQFCEDYVTEKDSKLSQKAKDEKLKETLKQWKDQVNELMLLDKLQLDNVVEKIVLNDVGKQKLLKSLDLKQFDIRKMVEESNLERKQASDLKIRLNFKLPKALVYLFSFENKPLLQLNLSSYELNYIIENSHSKLTLNIGSISVLGEQNCQIFQMNKNQRNSLEFFLNSIQTKTSVSLYMQKINVLYDPKIIHSIISFFTFTSIDSKLKNQALDRLQKIETNVTHQIKKSQTQGTLKIVLAGFRTTFFHPVNQLMLETGEIELSHESSQQKYKLSTKLIQLGILKHNSQKQTRIIQPFNLSLAYDMEKNSLQTQVPSLNVSLDKAVYLFLLQFSKIFSGEGKKQMMQKANIIGEIFVKENRWKKTLSVIHRGKIFLWDENQDYPKLKMRIRKAKEASKGKFSYIIIGDKKNEIRIAFKTEKQYTAWKQEIQKIVDFTIKSERKSERMSSVIEHRPGQTGKQMNINFLLNSLKVELKISDEKSMNFNMQNFIYDSCPQKRTSQEKQRNAKVSEVKIKGFKVYFDKKEIFTNKSLDAENFISCRFSDFEQTGDKDSQIQVNFEPFTLNFDPVFFIKLNFFLNTDDASSKGLYVIKSDETLDRQDQDKILSRIIIKAKQSSISFINKKTGINMMLVSFETFNAQILTKYYEFTLQGDFQGFTLSDISGYPNTVYEGDKYNKEDIIPKNILCESTKKNSIQFEYVWIEKGSSKYDEKKKELIKLQFNNFRLNFIQQPFFRIFDYIFVQLIGSINSPQFFEQFSSDQQLHEGRNHSIDFKKFVKKKDELIRSKALSRMQKKKLQQFLLHGVLFYIEFTFNNTEIDIVSDNMNEGMRFQVQKISLDNDYKFNSRQASSIQCQILTQLLKVQMSKISISMIEKSNKKIVNCEPISVKILVQMFNKDLQYKYLYGQNQVFNSSMSLLIDIEPCKIVFITESMITFKKIMLYNWQHDDGLDFLMIYDYMDFVPQMKINLKVICDAFCVEVQHEAQKIVLDAGNLSLLLNDTQKSLQLHVECQYFVVGYAQKEDYQQVLTSRKNFGKFQPRQTSFRNLITSYEVQKESKQSILLFQLKSNKQAKTELCYVSIEEVMIIFNAKFLLLLKKISMKNQVLIPMEKVFKQGKTLKYIPDDAFEKTLKIVANKILCCCKFPNSNGMILALLFTCNYKQAPDSRNCSFPHLQSFVTNETQISGQNIDMIKKRTILRPTQVRYIQVQQRIDCFVDRIFLKFSVNDIRALLKLQSDMMTKLSEITGSDKLQIAMKSSIRSLENESSHSHTRSLGQIMLKSSDPVKTRNLKLETIQLMIINDLQQNLIPLIYGNMNIEYESISSNIRVEFKLDFFNIRNSYWQPLIEKAKLLIKLQPSFRIMMQKPVDLSQDIPLRENKKDSRQFININISTNFIENFYKTLSNKNINFTKLYNAQQEIGMDEINSWVVVNQVGEDIICRSTDLKYDVYIPANESAKVTFLSNIKESFNPNTKIQEKERSVFMNVVIEDKLQFKQLNINELGLKKVWFVYKQKRYSILKNLVVDISKNVRYLTLSSMLEIQNQTNLSIMFFSPYQNKYFTLQPKSVKSLPFDLPADQVVLHGISQSEQRQPSFFFIKSLNGSEESDVIEQHSLAQIQKDKVINFNFMSLKVKTRFERMKKIFSIQPLYIIKNYLPQQLTIVLIDKDKQKMLNQYFIQGVNSTKNASNCGIHPIYHEINETQASIYVEGFQWTNFQSFYGKKKVTFKDFSHRQTEVRIYRFNDPQRTSEISFYYPLLVKNKTLSTIKVHSPNYKKSLTKDLKKDQSQILLSREIILEVDGGSSDQVYLRNRIQFFAFRKVSNHLKTFAKYFVYKNIEKINEDMTITEFKIFNKYLINNQTQGDLMLRPFQGRTGEVQTIYKGQVTDLLFFQIDSRISLGSVFQFCPKDSEYEWSHALNLFSVNQCTFFIRSRFLFTKLKHFQLDARRKTESSLQIVFKEIINEDEIPFVFVNQCYGKEIFVKNLLEKIDPGQSVHFNWDDPFENSQNVFLEIKQIKPQTKAVRPYTLNLNTKQTSIIIAFRSFTTNIEVEIIIEPTRKRIIFKDEQEKTLNQRQSEQSLEAQLQLPLRISLINNSITPVVHVIDFSFDLKLQKFVKGENVEVIKLELGSIQIDNQANHNALYPVILSTEMKLTYQKDKNQILEIEAKQVNLKIQENFFKSFLQLKSFFQNLLSQESTVSQGSLQKDMKISESSFFISKLILPRIIINLQVQTKNFSIETTINLQRPQTCSFPWKQFPYPIKKIALNILSHLSISPWAFVTSFKKGIQILLTEQSTGRAFQGFFGTVLGAISNSLSGVLGFIVGYDVQRVDNLIDGIDQGVGIFFRQLKEIPQFQTNSCSLGGILQGTGKTLINIVFKPIKGILRMTLKISQGVKKTAQFSFDEQTFIKTRRAMVFYNRQQYFLPYIKEQSTNLQRFKDITGNKLEFFYLVKFFPIPLYLDRMDLLLVMGTQYLVVLNVTRQSVLWIVEIAKIVKMEIIEVCKLRILAMEDGKEEKLALDSHLGTAVQKRKSVYKQSLSQKGNKNRDIQDVEYEIWMMNESQAIEVVEMYMKVKKSSKIML